MRFQLTRLVLWPRFADAAPRVVPFHPGAVNVITGHSKTGKSAIIPIIDYCLGSDRCAIPVGRIRRACSWFGVVVSTDAGEVLLARREPEHLRSTGDMFVMQAPQVDIPRSAPVKNMHVDEVKALLDRIAGLTQLNFAPERESNGGFKARPSFRDMMAFTFQPQNIVANPNVLLFKADSAEHREKLKTIFPFVLGAISPAVMLLQHDLQRNRGELKRKERELEAIRTISAQWMGEIRGRVQQAAQLGLLDIIPADDASTLQLLDVLRRAVQQADRLPVVTAQALDASASRLADLENDERDAATELSHLRRRHADMLRFQTAAEKYADAVSVRRDRLAVSDWVGTLYATEHECPLCGHADSPARETVEALRISLRRVEQLASRAAVPAGAVDRDLVIVRRATDALAERLNGIRRERDILTRDSETARIQQYQQSESARFAGTVTEALRQYDALVTDAALSAEVIRLRAEVSRLEQEVHERDVTKALERATQQVSNRIARLLPVFETERANDPVQLAVDELTIRVGGQDRNDFLWEIGSGANWLSYHVATTLALHQVFLGHKTSPIPSFIVYDQPSQVYFPKQAASAEDAQDVRDVTAAVIPDEDIRAVRRVFEAIASVVVESRGALQAVVLDHAAANVWGGIDGVRLVEEWRGGTKLVPEEWPLERAELPR